MSGRVEHRLKQLQFWAAAARILLLIDLIASGVLLGEAVAQAAGAIPLGAYPQAFGVVEIIGVVTSLLTVPILCIWIYRAHANLRLFGATGLNYSPGWAVGSFFVPFVNFVVPFRAMRELYNRSIGETADFADSDAPDVSAWWTGFVANALITSYFTTIAAIELRTPLFVTTPAFAVLGLSVFATLLSAVSTIYLMRVIKSISVAQRSIPGISGVFA